MFCLTGQEHNFNRYKPKDMDMAGGVYDFSSIMHYGNYAFTKNKRPTMLSVKDPMLQFGQISELSPTDAVQLNNMYDCKSKYRLLIRKYFWVVYNCRGKLILARAIEI